MGRTISATGKTKVLIHKVRFAGWIWKIQAPTGQRLPVSLRNMTKSEPRSLFELSQKLRPRNADRFERTYPVSKNRVISPKNGVSGYHKHEFGGFAEPIDLHGPICGSLSWRRPCQSPFLVFVYKRRAQKGYRRLPTSSSNHELNNIMYCICLDHHNKQFVHRKP